MHSQDQFRNPDHVEDHDWNVLCFECSLYQV